MELFTYLMAKNGHNTSVKKDLFSYLLGKNQSGTYQEYTGTSLSISNTKKGKMKVNLLGNTSQTGTPTPSSPIPVNVVSGDNTIVSIGKNLWGAEEHGGIDESTGQNISNANRWRTINYIKATPNTSYTLSSNASSNIWYIFYYYDKNKNFISSKALIGTASVTWTSPNNCEYIRAVIGDTGSIQTTERQLEVGSTATPYEPYTSTSYPIHLGTYELCKIGTYQDKFIRNSGKNICFNTTKPANANLKFFIDKPSQTFTISFTTNEALSNNSLYLEVDGTGYGNLGGITASANTIATKTYTLTDTQIQAIQNGTNIDLLLYKNGANFTIPTDAMVNEGSSALPYEPYGNGDLYLEKHIGKVVLDGTNVSATTRRGIANSKYGFGFNYDNAYRNGANEAGCIICNKLLNDTRDNIYNNNQGIAIVGTTDYYGTGCFIYTTATADMTLEAFNTWLASNIMEVYYRLETPTYTKIEGTLKEELEAVYRANSYKGTTNISQINNDLPFNMDVSIKVGN